MTKKEDNLYCYASKQSSVYSTFYFITTNKIDLKEYRYLYSNASVTIHSNGNGGHFLKVGLWDKKEYEYYRGNMIREPKMEQFVRYSSTVTNKKLIVDISKTTEETYITAGITSGGTNDSISTNVYEVWLEK